jgi:hypothetical protein
MKKGMGVLIFLFLAGMVLGTTQPAMLFAGESGGGNIWDQFVYNKPFQGTKLQGPLSIYYEYNFSGGDPVLCGSEGESYMATMYYTVRLKKGSDPTLWVFEGSSQRSNPCGICLTDILAQGAEINNFLADIVLGNLVAIPPIFPNGVKEWHLTSIDNAQFYDRGSPPSRAFIADIVIKAKQ